MSPVGTRFAQIIRLTRSFRFQSLFLRNASVFFLIVLIPMIFFGFFGFRNIDRNIRSAIEDINAAAGLRIRDTIDSVLRDTNRMAASLLLEHDIWGFFRSVWDPDQAIPVYRAIGRLTTRFAHVYPYIDSIYVYSETSDLVVAGYEVRNVAEFADNAWLTAYHGMLGRDLQLVSRKKYGVFPYLISGFRQEFSSDFRRLGATIVNMDVELLGRMFAPFDPVSLQEFYVINYDGTVLVHHDRDRIGVDIRTIPFFRGVNVYEGDETIAHGYDGGRYVVSWLQSSYGKLTYVVVLPFEMQFNRMAVARRYLVWTVIASIIASTIIAFFVSAYSYAPLSDVVMLLMNSGRFQGRSRHRSDEIQYIAESITSVIHSNMELKADVENRLGLLHTAQVSALQAQIHPHFLYNALEGINWQAIRAIGGANDVSRTIANLSDLLRYCLDSNHQMVRLSEEISHAQVYLSIMEVRFPRRWDVQWDIDEDARSCMVIRMLLQPILENAVQHGIIPTQRHGLITVSAKPYNGVLKITVTDNGAGMSAGALKNLNAGLSGPAEIRSDHIGLRNVNSRIRLLFSDRYGVRVYPAHPTGLRVRVEIPRTSSDAETTQ